MLTNLLLLIALIAHLFHTAWKIKKELHILQLNIYLNNRLFKKLRKKPKEASKIRLFLPLIACVPLFWGFNQIGAIVWSICYITLFLTRPRTVEKKPFVFTPRAKRLYTTYLILLFMLYAAIGYIGYMNQYEYLIYSFITLILINILSFFLVMISNCLIYPVEKFISHWYYRDAQKFINQFDALTKIAITGSYGKTSTKHFLHDLLAKQFNTLMTPKSYNSVMGVTKTIRESLKPIHEVFIAEMGATQRGDIKEMCNLVSPQIGILTAIGEQHLESLKTLENIKKTKYELIESLPADGIAFLNMDNPTIRELFDQIKIKKFRYGIETEDLDYYAKNIRTTPQGSFFTVCKYDGSHADFHTKILGKYNILNIVAATAVACELGMNLQTLIPLVKNINPVQYRLEIKHSDQGIVTINDAFNSNPKGAKMALNILNDITTKKKILITPGMVELGKMEYDLNKTFGIQATEICDFIILVGEKQTIPLQEALKEKKYPINQYYVAKNLKEAYSYLQNIIEPGDVILLENDLPDDYNET